MTVKKRGGAAYRVFTVFKARGYKHRPELERRMALVLRGRDFDIFTFELLFVHLNQCK